MRDLAREQSALSGRRDQQNYHRQVLIEYQRMNQVATEYERKHVYRIQCHDCSSVLTDRGMNVSRLLFNHICHVQTLYYLFGLL